MRTSRMQLEGENASLPVAPRLIVHQGGLTHLVAKSLDVGFRQLFALAKLSNPAVYFVLHVAMRSVEERGEGWD